LWDGEVDPQGTFLTSVSTRNVAGSLLCGFAARTFRWLEAGVEMAITIDPRHLRVGSHHRLWLLIEAFIAFFMAVLWAQPVG